MEQEIDEVMHRREPIKKINDLQLGDLVLMKKHQRTTLDTYA